MKVVILDSAAQDLKELRSYIIKEFSRETWLKTFGTIKTSIRNLAKFPLLGAIPPELEVLQLTQYRQILSGKNRIIDEPRPDALYIHIVVDARRDMKSLLMRRLMR